MRNIIPYDEPMSPTINAGVTAVMYSMLIPTKAKMRITHFANYLVDASGWTYITWSIRRNGIGVYPYNAVKDQIGYSAQVEAIQPIEFRGGDLFELVGINAHGATNYVVGARVKFELYDDL